MADLLMSVAIAWFLVIGVLLLGVAVVGSYVHRLPLSTTMLYLAAGYALGPHGFGLLELDPIKHAPFIERATEIAVIVSLFTAGLKLRIPLSDARWRAPLRLASLSMTLTVGAIAVAGVYGMGLSWGAAILLGAVLAPTDPVLASDVQVEHPFDYDQLRFSLTGEAGYNDGTAFPFVMLGLGLLGLHELGSYGLRWLLVDVLWAIVGGLAIGAVLGTGVARIVLHLRRVHREATGLDDFLAMGLIGVSYGVALLCHSYGFLAVFAAGLALRRVERRHRPEEQEPEHSVFETGQSAEEVATDPEKAPAAMAEAVLNFNEQLERMGELAIVVMIGAMLSLDIIPAASLWFVPLLFLVIRPGSVFIGVWGSAFPRRETRFAAWFGIRGIGSLYYLMYAIVHGTPEADARLLIGLTLATVSVSAIVHGVSVTPLMKLYSKRTDEQAR
ncbi:MAG TPA: sodium:proton antiporter [Bryobacteraceae bacterium]|nr:sodium:proton antiporter [Bryobacteraceae bacterium]